MIIKASQRSFGQELAAHLLNERDNEVVEVHAIRGFMSDTLYGAFQEAENISRSTKCHQYLFSVSLSPPKDAHVTTAQFEDAVSRLSDKLGLANQPHAIVFHEKDARRHCHVVYSRIDAEEMKAINLPFFKNKLMELSVDLYLENDWALPQGFVDRTKRNPLNFTLAEWQQAKRIGSDPKLTKYTLKQCWNTSDNKAAFESALNEHGYVLAKGDRRGYVAVDWRGEVYSLSRWCEVKPKALKERLGEPKALPSVEQTRGKLDQALVSRMKTLHTEIKNAYAPAFSRLQSQKDAIKRGHLQEREALKQSLELRQIEEQQARQTRFAKGMKGMWHRLTGRHAKVKAQNEIEAYQSLIRDQAEKDALVFRQIEERRSWQNSYDRVQGQYQEQCVKLQTAVFSKLPEDKIEILKPELEAERSISHDFGMEM